MKSPATETPKQSSGTNAGDVNLSLRGVRVLLAIASYGRKNIEFLKKVIRDYRRMEMNVTVIVLSEAPKDLGEDVRVVVGLPSKDCWSLPFAHKQVLAQNVDQYDLFIYSEDDIEVTERNIRAFVRATAELGPWEIAGYVRYETEESGRQILTDIHGAFHWKPDSVERRGDYIVAELTNEHAGFYILTQDQLRRAIASGGFLREPYQARYGLPETAATDAYTSCGFRKVICISTFDDFLIRHMSNLYVARHGLPLSSCREQIQTLLNILDGKEQAYTLSAVEPKVLQGRFSKSYYEDPCNELLRSIPGNARSILSIGCGCGNTEVELVRRGARLTALPLDSVMGVAAGKRGIEVIHGTLDRGLAALQKRTFDCVFMSNLLHLLPDHVSVLKRCAALVGNGGALVLRGPNFDFFKVLIRRLFKSGDYGKLSHFEQSGINLCGPSTIYRDLRGTRLRIDEVQWLNARTSNVLPPLVGRWTSRDWIVRAQTGTS